MGKCAVLDIPETLEEVLKLCREHKVAKISITQACVTIDLETILETQAPEPMTNTQLNPDPLFWSAQ